MNEEDKTLVEGYFREIKAYRSLRNREHVAIRNAKTRRNEHNAEVKRLIGEVGKLKTERDRLNKQVKQLKVDRTSHVNAMRSARERNDQTAVNKHNKAQDTLFKSVQKLAKEAQEFQLKMDSFSSTIETHKKLANTEHQKIPQFKQKSDVYHLSMTDVIKKVNELKEKHGVEFFEFETDEEE